MRLFLDQDVYVVTAHFLVASGHDVVRAGQVGLSRATDEQLLSATQEQGRIFVTRDRDFGALVFVNVLGSGVLYLRMRPSTQNAVHSELARVLRLYSEEELQKAFVVVEADGHRLRRLPGR